MHEDPILLRYDTVSMCNFFLSFETTNLAQHFRHRESGDALSYIEGRKLNIHLCKDIQNFTYHTILKYVTFLSSSTGNKPDLYSGAPRNESRSGYGPSLLR